MLRANDVSLDSVFYRRLTDSQLDRLHQASLEILQDIGARFLEPEALDIFRRAGMVVDGNLVRIPAWRVEGALRTAPKRLTLYDQTMQPSIRLEGRTSYYGNGSDLLYIIDHRTNERRPPTLRDVCDMMRVLDSEDHIDFVMSGFLPRDVPGDNAERLQMQAMLRYTNKHIIYVTTDLINAQHIVAMAETVAGGAEALRERPFATCYINTSNPLRHNPEAVQKLIWLSKKGLPFTFSPSVLTRGVTTPVTGAGFLSVNNACSLSALVLSQLVREGTPFIRCSKPGGTFDMRTMVGQYAGPEIRGFNEELLHYYGLPGFSKGGFTGAKTIDTQAAFEAALTLLTSVQAGGHLIHDVGYMDNGLLGSLEFQVVCHEIIGWIKAYMKPIVVNEETLGLDTVRDAVEGGGDFLGSDHTLQHFREDYYPRLLDRDNYDGWLRAGASSLRERARAHIEEILSTPATNLLTEEQDRAVQEIVDR